MSDELDDEKLRRIDRVIYHAVWLGGLLLSTAVILRCLHALESMDLTIIELHQAKKALLPILLWQALPFGLLSLSVKQLLSRWPSSRHSQTERRFISVGAFLGLLAAAGYQQYEFFWSQDPNGLYDTMRTFRGYILMLALPILAVLTAAAAVGGAIAEIVWTTWPLALKRRN